VVEVHVRAQHDVDRLARVSGVGERREKVRSARGQIGVAGHRVGPDARIDQDPDLARVDHEPVDRQLERAIGREEVRLEPSAVRGDGGGGRLGQEAVERQLHCHLRDPRDRHVPDLPAQRCHAEPPGAECAPGS
jgi:hypothetical protein